MSTDDRFLPQGKQILPKICQVRPMPYITMAPEQPAIIDRTVECCRTDLKQITILYQGPKIWNSLAAPITCSQSFPSFKKKR